MEKRERKIEKNEAEKGENIVKEVNSGAARKILEETAPNNKRKVATQGNVEKEDAVRGRRWGAIRSKKQGDLHRGSSSG